MFHFKRGVIALRLCRVPLLFVLTGVAFTGVPLTRFLSRPASITSGELVMHGVVQVIECSRRMRPSHSKSAVLLHKHHQLGTKLSFTFVLSSRLLLSELVRSTAHKVSCPRIPPCPILRNTLRWYAANSACVGTEETTIVNYDF